MSSLHTRSSSSRGLSDSLSRMFSLRTRRRGEGYLARVDVRIDPVGGIVGNVRGSRPMPYELRMALSLNDPELMLAACACPAAESTPCKHMWAALCAVDRYDAWPSKVAKPIGLDVTELDDSELELIAEDEAVPVQPVRAQVPQAPKLARAVAPPPAWRERVVYWPRGAQAPGGRPPSIVYLIASPPVRRGDAVRGSGGPVIDERSCIVQIAHSTRGKDGTVRSKRGRIDPARLGAADAAIHEQLFGVEAVVPIGGIMGLPFFHRAQQGEQAAVRIAGRRVTDVLLHVAATGRLGWVVDTAGTVEALAWDAGAPWSLEIALSQAGRDRAAVRAELVRGDDRIAFDTISAIAGGGLVIVGGRLIRVDTEGLGRWWRLLDGGLELPVSDVPALLEATCQLPAGPKLALADLGWTVEEVALTRRIVLEPQGRSGYAAHAELRYGETVVDIGRGALTVDTNRRRVHRRQLGEELTAAQGLGELGGWVDRPWSVTGSELRPLVTGAAARGWEVWYRGGRLRTTAGVSASVTSGTDWFDLALEVSDEGAHASTPELLAALRGGRPLLQLSDGTAAMIPPWLDARAAALMAAHEVDGALRFRPAEALMVTALLDGTGEARVDVAFERLRNRLEGFAGVKPRAAPRTFRAKLRDYQRDGLGWLHFLRELGLGGCLADDMGLGKTVQVLALLDGIRAERGGGAGKASLVVAPRSLVFHWIDEARRFAPRLRILEWHGTGRASRLADLASADLVVTTYGTLRHDLERLGAIDFELVILDEAHAIKNATTATSRAVRALRGSHRLALTGTPVENQLDDLASIFDFLNPGLLGRPAALRALGSVDMRSPASPSSGEELARAADIARARAIGKVLRPFLLRRTKQEVLTELPAKTEQIIGCRLEGAERKRYDELRLHYRRALLPAVERDGVGKNAIIVLEALLRLRQAALHPGLLDPARVSDDSSKLDALLGHLRDVIASGHRALVFSQFTTLLAIVRARLEHEAIAYEYLDGGTRDRRSRVAAFQNGEASVFLLSLKAGGTGLNLTAADHVFLLDPWWNPAVEAQAIDRVHRIGQARPVTAYRLVAENTVEEKILALQDHKRALFDSVFEDKGVVARLSADDLRSLLD